MNTTHPLARLILALMAICFLPVGVWVVKGAFTSQEPHLFVMLVFSGSLSFLVGLVGVVGLVASFVKSSPSSTDNRD